MAKENTLLVYTILLAGVWPCWSRLIILESDNSNLFNTRMAINATDLLYSHKTC